MCLQQRIGLEGSFENDGGIFGTERIRRAALKCLSGKHGKCGIDEAVYTNIES